jgi:HTH-type transcriptional regulator / antitoxin HigA
VSKTATVVEEMMMKQQVRVIKTQCDYDAAIARLSALMGQGLMSGSNKEAELELLALVIESYERSKVEPIKPEPIEAIMFRMDQQNLSKKDLIPYLGSLSKVSEVLSRKRSLSLAMIRKLHSGLGIPAEVLIAGSDEEGLNLGSGPQYEYSKFPLQEMLERGYFAEFTGDLKQVKEYAEDLVRKFMRGMGGDSTGLALLRAPLHQNGSRLMDDYALLIWRVAVLSKARRQKTSNRYVEGTITADWLRDLAKLSRFEQGPRLAQEFLADSGIVLVIEEHFKKTYLDGAAMLDDDVPIVALTLRHDRLDNFWFALLHELVHVQKHLKKSTSHVFIADNLDDKTRSSQEEREADDGAREALIPSAEWLNAAVKVIPTQENATALANKLRIHPAIVAGRVRYETNNWRILNNLKGEVRKIFENQLGGLQARTS